MKRVEGIVKKNGSAKLHQKRKKSHALRSPGEGGKKRE